MRRCNSAVVSSIPGRSTWYKIPGRAICRRTQKKALCMGKKITWIEPPTPQSWVNTRTLIRVRLQDFFHQRISFLKRDFFPQVRFSFSQHFFCTSNFVLLYYRACRVKCDKWFCKFRHQTNKKKNEKIFGNVAIFCPSWNQKTLRISLATLGPTWNLIHLQC